MKLILLLWHATGLSQHEGQEHSDGDQDDDPDEAEQSEEEGSAPPSRTTSNVEAAEASMENIELTGLASQSSPAAKRQKRSKKLGCLVLLPEADGESGAAQAHLYFPAVHCAVACHAAAQLRVLQNAYTY